MLLGGEKYSKTHYEILSLKEDATHEEIRSSYRSSILIFHPDKSNNNCEGEEKSREDFLKIRKAWEILGDPRSRANYDRELRASRQLLAVADDVELEEMGIEQDSEGEAFELYHPCRCGDYYWVSSSELGEMGVSLNGKRIGKHGLGAVERELLLPCGSCSLKIRLKIPVN
ncbi:DPH4 homolog [Amborella trichopoda]|uniref:J domain-containing protein n=1 Tax=Amborella trichopoda TaxID=13333 RepID=W1PW88_AMBTC|nr:DPH4 homolog [Amborella trichopoda]XP_020526440.1 DPH4 homolog [Amborella trichopoda]XP_020526441.1 DPH4 homolog [Amborella trichopoda]XP_020526442.1 DPH4 homolog [Amborella trichopoda]ERN11585.1 hypothetical protein AMTR_s00022p00175580 [Amborella trichopoda]|eukprot:XP_020526439.1 DPH4 homolog [Amborella trichopoda]